MKELTGTKHEMGRALNLTWCFLVFHSNERESGKYLTLDRTSQLAVEIHQRLKKKDHGSTLIGRGNPTETHNLESKEERREKMHANETNTDKESGQLIG
jgi:hypothetical protein